MRHAHACCSSWACDVANALWSAEAYQIMSSFSHAVSIPAAVLLARLLSPSSLFLKVLLGYLMWPAHAYSEEAVRVLHLEEEQGHARPRVVDDPECSYFSLVQLFLQ